jgi:ribosome-associated protein
MGIEGAALPGPTREQAITLGVDDLMSQSDRTSLVIGARPINLTQVLKLAGWVMSGGEGKALIAAGHVQVNGEIELRKRRQMEAGDVVTLKDGPSVELHGSD